MSDRGLEPLSRPVTDADRQRAVVLLREAAGRGILDIHELDDRLGAAFRVQSVAELSALTWDLQDAAVAAPAPARKRGLLHNTGFRFHLAAYTMVNSFLVGTWALTGHGFFWPFFPAAGTGIGLGMHGLVAAGAQSRREAREARQRQRAVDRALAGPSRELGRPHPTSVKVRPMGGVEVTFAPDPRRRPARPPRSAPPAEGGVQYVVVMFIDIVGSTGLNERFGDAEWTRLLNEHRTLLRGCVGDAGGAEVSAQGDGLLVRFEHPAQAGACAIDVQQRLVDQRAERFTPQVRIGIHCGEAVHDDGDVLGAVVNLASRVTDVAGPGEILMTESVADRLGPDLEAEDRGLHPLKGVARPRHLLALRW